jgi:D-arabinose 1-dehydrogenase-like Zn-dependent alcohol dehydrogenase
MMFTVMPWFGGFSTSVQLPSNYAIKIPSNIDLEMIPSLMCAGGTVYAPLRRHAVPGGKCAIVGIGGLGHLAIQFAAKMGMKVYACTTSDNKNEYIKKLGAHEIVNTNNEEQYNKFIAEEIDLIVNTSMSGDLAKYIKTLKKGSGVFVQIGDPETEVKIDLFDIVMKQVSFTGSAAASRSDLNNMIDFCLTHGIEPMIEKFSFDDFPKALDRIMNGKPEFRVVVDLTKQ